MAQQLEVVKDYLNRPIRDVRISVTDQCNFRCAYCMPAEIFGPDFPFMKEKELLSFDEIERLVTNLATLGVEKVRLTGGEPLLRKDLHLLIERLNKIEGIHDIALTTNGVHLPKQAKKLAEAGLQRVNISLDTLDEELFKQINGRGVGVKPVLKGIYASIEAGLEVKINMVVKKGLNDHHIVPMTSFIKDLGVTLRFIEFMDVGSSNGWKFDYVVTKKEIFNILQEHFQLEPVNPAHYGEVAKRYRHKGTKSEIGFITSVSEAFCSTCTRARISADGRFYNCLFATKGFSLRDLLRKGTTDEELIEVIKNIWSKRADRYSEERTEETARNRKKIEMSYIGG